MHVCLLPTETLLHIFAILAHEEILQEPAAGVTDRDLQGKLTLKRPLKQRVEGYAQRIRSLTVFYSDLDTIDDRVIQTSISTPSPTPLLPNLRSLGWWDDRECFLPLLRTVLGSTITSASLGFGLTTQSFATSALLASLGARCLSIQELDCVCRGDSEESSDAKCEAICGLRELRRLRIGVLNTQVLLHLISLPSLKSLDFSLRTYDIHKMQTNSPPTFSSQLNQVHITAPTPSGLSHFLRNIYFLSCRSVNACVDYSNLDPELAEDLEVPYDPPDIPDFIVSISKCFSPALEKLQIDFDYEFSTLFAQNTLASPNFALDFDVVAPRPPCCRLVALRTHTSIGCALRSSMMPHSRQWRNPGLSSRGSRWELQLVG
ncbi:uncharacterized protein EDB91DRAFT_1296494 [Suillus paluster]|uniref:uncharacterized protein n=1 Tax=Suillus paluster TaxID=48578 RepID=UPI001B871CF1|nr:uncharacterized protein EDB91DRAFT_1296494 [Suillus paluster]KAG1734674.1 hypothetical protein EDB91DRAFT_1296494 [Suillus paluster]